MKVLKNSKLKILIISILAIVMLSTVVLAENSTSSYDPTVDEMPNSTDSNSDISSVSNVISVVTNTTSDSGIVSEENVVNTNVVFDESGTSQSASSEDSQEILTSAIDIASITNSDVYLTSDTVSLTDKVVGNVFIIANKVNINTTIDGNVFILAHSVSIASKSYIYNSAFICADDIVIAGYINDLYSMSDSLKLSTNATILRDVRSVCTDLSLSGEIMRNAYFTVDTVTVNQATAKVSGDLHYSSSSENIPASIVAGKVYYEQIKENNSFSHFFDGMLSTLVMSIIIILIVVLATPKLIEKEQEILKTKLAKSAGYGALVLILIPIACIILCFTIIGILPAMSILFAYIFILSIASNFVAIPLAKMICDKLNKNSKTIQILLSIILVLVIWILEQIPFIGFIIGLAVSIISLGILTYCIVNAIKNKKSKNSVDVPTDDKK